MGWPRVIRIEHIGSKRGFTTIELIVVVVAFAILASVSIPLIQNYLAIYHLKQAARNIVSQMQIARIEAIKRRMQTVVVFDPSAFNPAGGGKYSIYADTDRDWNQDAGEPVLLPPTDMPRRVTLALAVFDDNGSGQPTSTRSCGFDPGGAAAWALGGHNPVTGNIQLINSKSDTRTIRFWASGKTEIQ